MAAVQIVTITIFKFGKKLMHIVIWVVGTVPMQKIALVGKFHI
jgi:hypothetical protein